MKYLIKTVSLTLHYLEEEEREKSNYYKKGGYRLYQI